MLVSVPALIVYLIKFPNSKKVYDGLSKNKDSKSENESNPVSVLKMRLAKGEITKEEFDRIKDDLKE